MYYMTNRLSYFLYMQVLLEGGIWEGLHLDGEFQGARMYQSSSPILPCSLSTNQHLGILFAPKFL